MFFDSNGDGANDTTAVTDNPATPLAADPTHITVIDEAAIPTLTAGAQMLTCCWPASAW